MGREQVGLKAGIKEGLWVMWVMYLLVQFGLEIESDLDTLV